MINKTLAILAGGKSSRMDYNNKALLLYREKKFIEYIISAGKDYKEIIIIANSSEEYKSYNLRVINDIYKEHGPIGGIHTALLNSNTEHVLCVACDMPFVTKETLDILGSFKGEYDVLVPEVNERLQPLCAIYSKGIISNLEEAIKKNNNKLQLLIKSLNYKIIQGSKDKKFSDSDFRNVNTVEEYSELE